MTGLESPDPFFEAVLRVIVPTFVVLSATLITNCFFPLTVICERSIGKSEFDIDRKMSRTYVDILELKNSTPPIQLSQTCKEEIEIEGELKRGDERVIR